MRAMDGAIDSVRIDPVTYEPSFTVLGAVNDAVDTGHAASCSEHTAVGTAHSADYNSRNAEFCGPKGICGSGIIDPRPNYLRIKSLRQRDASVSKMRIYPER